jgi:Na+-transporting methylmalonyl-CoA/oxaloacetate decarboxylase gamma subunit
MEVHHHPHVEKKSFKEYFLEFLMIFLAVTMGFFAENIREHFVEKKKEIKTIATFKNELQKDTARLNSIINVYIPAHNFWTDSAIKLINANKLRGNEKTVFKVITNACAWQVYSTPEIAMNILKNSGYYNLIENTELKKEILGYDVIIQNYSNYSNFISSVQHTVDTSTLSFFKLNDVIYGLGKEYQASLKDGQFFIADKDIPSDLIFKTYDKTVFLAFAARLEQITLLLNDITSHYHFIQDQEVKLLKSINKDYPE